MKVYQQNVCRGDKGWTLIECLIYLALFFLVGWLAFEAFYRTWDHTRALNRGADEIAATLKAGEQWRADVRAAVAAPETVEQGDSKVFRLRQKGREVNYVFRTNTVVREVEGLPPVVLLANVKACAIEKEQRRQVLALKCEIELKTRQKSAHVRPLFTFTAVSGEAARR